jgi:hypothetical protein
LFRADTTKVIIFVGFLDMRLLNFRGLLLEKAGWQFCNRAVASELCQRGIAFCENYFNVLPGSKFRQYYCLL